MKRGSNSTAAPAPNKFARAVNAELRAWAGRRSLSQRKLADMSGIPQRTLGKMVWLEQRPLTVHYLDVLCNALRVDPADIVSAAERNMDRLEEAPGPVTQDNYRLAAKEDDAPDVNEEDYFG